MTSSPLAERPALCADISRQLGEDPVGTAPHWQEVTVLELDVAVWSQLRRPEDWTATQAEVFERLRGKVEGSGAGFGLLMSAPTAPGGPLRMRHYTLGAGGYHRQDYCSPWPQSEWARGLNDTLLEPDNLRHWTKAQAPSGADMHVCTHGTVDAACGKYGVPVYAALQAAGERAWRTGHFGGHRFAATAVELASGLVWAHLTPQLAVKVARREVQPAEVTAHLRGYAGLAPLAQVLDRELLAQHGWGWLEGERRAEVSGEEVSLTHVWRGQVQQFRAAVSHKLLSVPTSSHSSERSSVNQYRVTWR